MNGSGAPRKNTNPLARTSTVVLLLLMLALGALAFAGRFVGELRERTGDMDPRALENPLLSLGMLQEQLGAKVTFHTTWEGLPPEGATLWLATPGRMLGDATVRELRDWVARGGRLVILPLHEHLWRNDDPLLRGAAIRREELMEEELGGVFGNAATRRKVFGDGMLLGTQDSGRLRAGLLHPVDILQADHADAEGLLCHELGCLAVRVPQGNGSISAFARPGLLANGPLQDHDHAAITWLLAPVQPGGEVHVVYGARVAGLDALLLEHAPLPLLALLASVVLWLWRVTARPGPVLPSPLPARRRLGEHIAATGHFLAAHGGARLLWQASRTACLRRLQRRYPQLPDVADPGALAALAKLTGWAPDRLRQALAPPDDEHWPACARRIAQLEALRRLP